MRRPLKPSLAAALLCAALAAAAALPGCGQTGGLYFDEDPPADQLPPSKKSGTAPVPVSVTP